jgi:hypothetical protein
MAIQTALDSISNSSGSPFGFKNRIINGAMVIDQRNAGSSFTVPNSAGYGSCDRWASLAGATSTWTMQRVATADSDFPNALRVGRNAGSASTSAIYVGQVIETNNCQDLAGQSVTYSFFAKAGANFSASGGNLICEVWTGSGTDQGWTSLGNATWTSQALAASNNATLTTTRQRFTYSFSIAAGTKEIAVRFWYAGVGTAGANDWFEVTGVQLEEGSTASSFDYRDYGRELAMCQRYYEKSYNIDVAPASVSDLGAILHRPPSTSINITTPFKVAKRASPSVTVYSPVTGTSSRFRNYTSGADLTVGGVAFIGMWGASPYSDASTANNQYAFQFVAESEL